MVDMKNMSSKEKAEYLWDYYKIHIISTLVVIALVGYFIYGQVTKVDYIFNLTVLESYNDEAGRLKLEKDITNVLVKDSKERKKASVSILPVDSSNGLNKVNFDKFSVQIAAGEIDLMILNKNDFEKYKQSDIFANLKDIKELNLKDFKDEKVDSGIEAKENEVYAISIKDSKKLKEVNFDTNDKVIAVSVNSKNIDKIVLVLNWLLN